MSAQQQLTVIQDDDGWRLAEEEEATVQPRSDEKVVLSNLRVPEGRLPCLNTGRCLIPMTACLMPLAPRRRQRCYFP